MIARLTYEDGDIGPQTATLGDDAHWTCSDSVMTATLNILIAGEDRSPSRGDWLGWHAGKVAKLLDAAIELEPKRAAPAGIVY